MAEEEKDIDFPYQNHVLNDETGRTLALIREVSANVRCCLPAIVKEYNPEKGTVVVLPLAEYVAKSDGEDVSWRRAECEVRLRQINCGGISIHTPVYVGDTGWVIAADRCCDSIIKKNSAVQNKNCEEKDGKFGDNEGTGRPDSMSLGEYAWGFFIPDNWAEVRGRKQGEFSLSFTPENGESRGSSSVIVNKDGISVSRTTDNGEDKVSLCDDGIKFSGRVDEVKRFVTDVRYDRDTNRFECKKIGLKFRGDAVVGAEAESNWGVIEGGETVAIPSEGETAESGLLVHTP